MIIEKIEYIAARMGAQRHLVALRNGVVLGMPLIIIGSLFLLIGNLPIESYTNWLESTGLDFYINKAVDGSFGIIALVASYGVAANLAKSYQVDSESAGVLSLSVFVILTPLAQVEEEASILYEFL